MQVTTTKKNILGLVYLSAERYIVTVEVAKEAYKIFQIFFNKKDGSLHLGFPYFSHKEGILSEAKISGGTTFPNELSLIPGGKATKHQVHYSHHVDGHAHFAENKKIYTKIRKKSVPLKSKSGHIFTVQIWGIPSFEKIAKEKDKISTNNRTILTFEFKEMPLAIKFVGMWYSTRLARKNYSGPLGNGPKFPFMSPDGKIKEGLALVDPFLEDGEEYALVLYCEIVPSEDTQEALTFIGGFDPPEIVHNHSRDTTVLSLMYPAGNIDELIKQIGSIDFS
ncbi:MAG: hypothetical protein HYZ24_17705 [Chloroflexi bacterium]|jgi:hypothetical protein|nr:hypothetical protein [Chloroflexota bacterium]